MRRLSVVSALSIAAVLALASLSGCAGPPAPGDVPPDLLDHVPAAELEAMQADTLPDPASLRAPGAAVSHEPIGFKPLIEHDLQTIRTNGTGVVGFASWGGSGLGSVVDPIKGVPVLNCRYNTGMRGGSPSCTIWADAKALKAANVRQVYTRFEMWVDKSFKGHASGGDKIVVAGVGTAPNQYVGTLTGVGGANLRMRNYVQGVNPPLPAIPAGQSWGGPSCGGYGCSWAPPPGGPQVTRGVWHTIEFLNVSGPAGSRSSSMTVWMDGALAATYSGFDYLYPGKQGLDPRWSKWTLSTYWGGTGGTYPSPAADIRFSNLYVSGAP